MRRGLTLPTRKLVRPRFRVATLEEAQHYGAEGLRQRGLYAPVAGATGWAFVREVQQWSYTDSSTTETITLSHAVSAGDTLVIPWSNASSITNVLVSVSDSASNTWAVATANTLDPSDPSCGVAYGIVSTALTTSSTITLTWTNTGYNYKYGTILDFSGGATSSIFDTVANHAASYGTAVSCPITTGSANELIVGVLADSNNLAYTVAGGFTDENNQVYGSQRSDYVYLVATSATGYDPAGSVASNSIVYGSLIALNPGSSGPGPVTPPTLYAPILNAAGFMGT